MPTLKQVRRVRWESGDGAALRPLRTEVELCLELNGRGKLGKDFLDANVSDAQSFWAAFEEELNEFVEGTVAEVQQLVKSGGGEDAVKAAIRCLTGLNDRCRAHFRRGSARFERSLNESQRKRAKSSSWPKDAKLRAKLRGAFKGFRLGADMEPTLRSAGLDLNPILTAVADVDKALHRLFQWADRDAKYRERFRAQFGDYVEAGQRLDQAINAGTPESKLARKREALKILRNKSTRTAGRCRLIVSQLERWRNRLRRALMRTQQNFERARMLDGWGEIRAPLMRARGRNRRLLLDLKNLRLALAEAEKWLNAQGELPAFSEADGISGPIVNAPDIASHMRSVRGKSAILSSFIGQFQ